eukprot:9492448-Pyramimonas_sp.AAC.1
MSFSYAMFTVVEKKPKVKKPKVKKVKVPVPALGSKLHEHVVCNAKTLNQPLGLPQFQVTIAQISAEVLNIEMLGEALQSLEDPLHSSCQRTLVSSCVAASKRATAPDTELN